MKIEPKLSPPANPRETCVAPSRRDPRKLCGDHATEQRVVDDLVVALCPKHARELDAGES